MVEERTPIDLNFLKPDKCFIYPLFSETGERVLEARVLLSAEKIKEIKQKYGSILYYINSIESPILPKKNIEKALQVSREIMNEILVTDKLKKETYRKTEQMIESIVSNLTSADLIVLNLLKKLKSYEEYLYHHSVNVGILSALMAKKTGRFTSEEIKYIGLGAYLIDIGQMKIDKQLLKINGIYDVTHMQKMKRHPQLGYELLEEIPGVHPIVTQTVLFHHEKFNDKGYYLLPYDNLPLPPKIASVCDAFDAMTSQRPYRNAFTVSDSLIQIVNSININYSYELVSIFINHLGGILNKNQIFYSKKDMVELNTNEFAIVKDFGKIDSLKPTILAFSRFQKEKNQISIKFYKRPIEIDLEKDINRHITKFITNKIQIESLKINLMKRKLLLDYL